MLTGPREGPSTTKCAGPAHVGDRPDLASARCREESQRVAHVEKVSAHQLGYLARGRRRARTWRPSKVPLLRIVVQPGGSIDFAHPDLGFPGHQYRPPPERTLKLWADDLLSVGHGEDWMFVVGSSIPLDRRWLDLLDRTARARVAPGLAVVFASFAGPARPGPFRMADVDPTTHTTLVHVEDHRGSRVEPVTGVEPATSSLQVRRSTN